MGVPQLRYRWWFPGQVFTEAFLGNCHQHQGWRRERHNTDHFHGPLNHPSLHTLSSLIKCTFHQIHIVLLQGRCPSVSRFHYNLQWFYLFVCFLCFFLLPPGQGALCGWEVGHMPRLITPVPAQWLTHSMHLMNIWWIKKRQMNIKKEMNKWNLLT